MSLIQYPAKLFSFLFIEIQWIFQNKLSKHNNQYKQKFSVTTHNQEDQISFTKKEKKKKKKKEDQIFTWKTLQQEGKTMGSSPVKNFTIK